MPATPYCPAVGRRWGGSSQGTASVPAQASPPGAPLRHMLKPSFHQAGKVMEIISF